MFFVIKQITKKIKQKSHFYFFLNKWFPEKIRTDLTLGTFSNNKKPYLTDFVYCSSPKSDLFIDIEIDQPYELHETGGKTYFFEKNYLGVNDERDAYFTKNGWYVIRFSEEQVVKYQESCCKYIGTLLFKITFRFKYILDFYGFPNLPEMPMWTKEESNYMAINKLRDVYLKPNLFFPN